MPDTRASLTRRLALLTTNREIVIQALRQLLALYQERKVLRARQEEEDVKDEPGEEESEGEEVTVVSASDGATTEVAKLEQEVISALKDDTEGDW